MPSARRREYFGLVWGFGRSYIYILVTGRRAIVQYAGQFLDCDKIVVNIAFVIDFLWYTPLEMLLTNRLTYAGVT